LASGVRNKEEYEIFKSRIDIESFIDDTVVECFFGNIDWIVNNVGFWRYRGIDKVPDTEFDSRWRWFLYDLDY
jgi:NAD(P)-dependent dehydrogenase (short-subunit alcohol dehydrogenase family)